MGVQEDFDTLRRAAVAMERALADEYRGPDDPPSLFMCSAALFRKASARELLYAELTRRPFYGEVIDLAYAVLGEARPGGSAADEYNRVNTGGAG